MPFLPTTLLLLGLLCSAAQAQIYMGTTASGGIVLSSSPQAGVDELLVPAPPAPASVEVVLTTAQPAPLPAALAAHIQEASRASQLPAALISAVIQAESNYNPRAVSPKGAQGLMQLMPATARRFGATNSWDPRDNILTGSRYLRWLMDYFDQDLPLAIAAYNAGEMAVVQAGRRVPRFAETEKYVPRVLALYHKALGQL